MSLSLTYLTAKEAMAFAANTRSIMLDNEVCPVTVKYIDLTKIPSVFCLSGWKKKSEESVRKNLISFGVDKNCIIIRHVEPQDQEDFVISAFEYFPGITIQVRDEEIDPTSFGVIYSQKRNTTIASNAVSDVPVVYEIPDDFQLPASSATPVAARPFKVSEEAVKKEKESTNLEEVTKTLSMLGSTVFQMQKEFQSVIDKMQAQQFQMHDQAMGRLQQLSQALPQAVMPQVQPIIQPEQPPQQPIIPAPEKLDNHESEQEVAPERASKKRKTSNIGKN